jgi:hypothetical protein
MLHPRLADSHRLHGVNLAGGPAIGNYKNAGCKHADSRYIEQIARRCYTSHVVRISRNVFLRLMLPPMLTLAAVFPALAAQSVQMKVDVGEKLIYCQAELTQDTAATKRVLNEGEHITFKWEISVEEINDYWLNSEVATVEVIRRVVPDLVGRSWLLEDMTSGITQRVFDLDEAIYFLTRLQRFAVIDRTLLDEDGRYRLRVSLEEHEGESAGGWLSFLWGFEQIEAALDFALP